MLNIELAQLRDGNLALLCDQRFPHDVKRVEYYRDQRLFMLVYDDQDHEGDLMHYELSDFANDLVRKSSGQITIVSAPKGQEILGDDVPLIQVGI